MLGLGTALGCPSKPGVDVDADQDTGTQDTSSPDTGEPDTGTEMECDPFEVGLVSEWSGVDLVGEAELPDLGGNAGVGVGDLDGDGWPDAIVVTPVGSAALHNDGTGKLVPETDWVGGAWPAATGIALADVDGDGDLDAWLGRMSGQPDLLLTNDGTGHMDAEEIPQSLGESYSGSFRDMDGDGDLDLFVARYAAELDIAGVLAGDVVGEGNSIYRNQDGSLEWAPDALPAEVVDDVTFHGQWLEANGDGVPDLYLASDFGPFLGRNRLLLGDGTGSFFVADDCACDLAMFGMGVGVGDGDGDGLQDLYITDLAGPNLLQGDGDGRFHDASLATGAHIPDDGVHLASWGTAFVDLSGDGWQDLAMVFGRVDPGGEADALQGLGAGYEDWLDSAGQRDVLLIHDGTGRYEDASDASGFSHDGDGRSLAVGDFDRDGRPDLLTAGMWFARHWRGQGGCEGRVSLVVDSASLHQSIGARITAVVDGETRSLWILPSTTWSSSEHAQWLGLGQAMKADEIVVDWPDGSRQTWENVEAGSTLVLSVGDGD